MRDERITDAIRYVGDAAVDTDRHDGGLRPAVGASHFQALRANRFRHDLADGFGWTYNHAPMLAYWKGRLHLQYLSNPSGEHVPPGHTLLARSDNGIDWQAPVVAFPVLGISDEDHDSAGTPRDLRHSLAVMHQRMGFYTAPDGRLLACGFYSFCRRPEYGPNNGQGMGRVAREVREDGTMGPIHFVRYNRSAGWNRTNTPFPFFEESADAGFVRACRALLADRLVTLQWWEEDRGTDGFYPASMNQKGTGGSLFKAFCWYTLPDGRTAGLWKFSLAGVSRDRGESWEELGISPSLVMAGAKVWGQRTPDGRYALVYNPTPSDCHRWPLAVVSGDDGRNFDGMLCVNDLVSPRRYPGIYKDPGFNYVRGVCENCQRPPGDAFWVAYSMNKEDIWVSRIPTPLRHRVDGPVDDDFGRGKSPEGLHRDWNLHIGKWAWARVPTTEGRSVLRLHDEDPVDAAQALRVFPESRKARIDLEILPRRLRRGGLWVGVSDARGTTPIEMTLGAADGLIRARSSSFLRDLEGFREGVPCRVRIDIDAVGQRFAVTVDGDRLLADGVFARPVRSVERIVFRTKPPLRQPDTDTVRDSSGDLPIPGIPNCASPVEAAEYDILRLRAAAVEEH